MSNLIRDATIQNGPETSCREGLITMAGQGFKREEPFLNLHGPQKHLGVVKHFGKFKGNPSWWAFRVPLPGAEWAEILAK